MPSAPSVNATRNHGDYLELPLGFSLNDTPLTLTGYTVAAPKLTAGYVQSAPEVTIRDLSAEEFAAITEPDKYNFTWRMFVIQGETKPRTDSSSRVDEYRVRFTSAVSSTQIESLLKVKVTVS